MNTKELINYCANQAILQDKLIEAVEKALKQERYLIWILKGNAYETQAED